MRYLDFRIQNYKSIKDTGIISLQPGFNVLIGKNDSGKTALLEALALRAGGRPHRSLSTIPTPLSQPDGISRIQAKLAVAWSELEGLLAARDLVYLPGRDSVSPANVYSQTIDRLETIQTLTAEWRNAELSVARIDELTAPGENSNLIEVRNLSFPTAFRPEMTGSIGRAGPTIAQIAAERFSSQVFHFRAERLGVAEWAANGNSALAPNASNLAEVLNRLQSTNPTRFKRFESDVRSIFPHITQITAPIVSPSLARVFVWSVDPQSEREDLAVPLAESGTGLGQVFAILYVLATAISPQVILIDEPHSFLHPGAARKLFEILGQSKQHQYVVTTHSPASLNAIDTPILLKVARSDFETKVDPVSQRSTEDLRLLLADLGASLSDAFVADQILWVEGKTEETCFPLIVRARPGKLLGGTQIIALHSTGELEAKNAERVFDIYKQLSKSTSILPPPVAFILDPEKRSNDLLTKMQGKSGDKIRWLPRRMFECYLLDAVAITAVLTAEDAGAPIPLAKSDVSEWIKAHANGPEHFVQGSAIPSYPSAEWDKRVDAARLLDELFGDLTNHRVSYHKVRHGRMLTEKCIERRTAAVEELADFLIGILESPPNPDL